MRKLLAAVLFSAISMVQTQAPRAAELLMFEEDWCAWCEQWNAEIGPIYPLSTEGKRAPLRRIDIHGTYPAGIALDSRPQFTPTFVLVEDGREIGRIEGYPGEDFFWGLLSRIMKKLPKAAADPAPDPGTGNS